MNKQSNIKTIVAGAMLGAVVALGGAFYMFNKLQHMLEQHIEHTPPTIIVDYSRLTQYFQSDSEEDLGLLDQISEAILRLQNAGFIVLDGQAVLAAPANIYLPEDLLELD